MRQFEIETPTPGRPRRVLDHNGMMQVVKLEEGQQPGYDHFPAKTPWRGSRDLRPHALPETVRVSDSKRQVDWEARVEYVLIAKVERPGSASVGSKIFASMGARGGDVEAIVHVTVKNPLDDADREMLKERQTMHFERWMGTGEKKGKGPSLGRALSKLTRRNTNADTSTDSTAATRQGLKVSFTISTPKAIQSQSTVPFTLKARITVPASSISTFKDAWPPPPQPTQDQTQTPLIDPISATVTDLTVTLHRETRVRDDSLAATEHTAIKHEKDVLCWRRDLWGLDMLLVGEELPAGEGNTESQDTADDTPLPPESLRTFSGEISLESLIHTPALTPSFSTYNIAVEYTLSFTLTLSILGETVTLSSSDSDGRTGSEDQEGMEGETLRVVVLPASTVVDEEEELEGGAVGLSKRTAGDEKQDAKVGGGLISSKEAEAVVDREKARQERSLDENGSEEELPAYEP